MSGHSYCWPSVSWFASRCFSQEPVLKRLCAVRPPFPSGSSCWRCYTLFAVQKEVKGVAIGQGLSLETLGKGRALDALACLGLPWACLGTPSAITRGGMLLRAGEGGRRELFAPPVRQGMVTHAPHALLYFRDSQGGPLLRLQRDTRALRYP